MPTSKLWIEHTERAAWDSVDALRERLTQAERRLEALALGADGVPKLFELLEAAKRDRALSGESHAAVLEALLEKLRLAEQAATPRPPAQAPVSELTGSVPAQRPREPELPRDLDRLLELIEAKVDDLSELDGPSLGEAADDLSALASRLSDAVRGKPSGNPSARATGDDDDDL